MIEGQAERDDRRYLQDDERDVLQSLPHQLQESLGLLRRDQVLSEGGVALLQIRRVSGKP